MSVRGFFCLFVYFHFTFIGVLIRRKKSDVNPVQQVFVTPILSAQAPTKFIIEVANSMVFSPSLFISL